MTFPRLGGRQQLCILWQRWKRWKGNWVLLLRGANGKKHRARKMTPNKLILMFLQHNEAAPLYPFLLRYLGHYRTNLKPQTRLKNSYLASRKHSCSLIYIKGDLRLLVWILLSTRDLGICLPPTWRLSPPRAPWARPLKSWLRLGTLLQVNYQKKCQIQRTNIFQGPPVKFTISSRTFPVFASSSCVCVASHSYANCLKGCMCELNLHYLVSSTEVYNADNAPELKSESGTRLLPSRWNTYKESAVVCLPL